ncbi:MAG: aminotransferase class I/II-fold pyridoxal phosphate-dependent enzyme [Candidatus Omnitrophica bacterium]|nr:aminotransferase class I/II-fold pyridoxal phosphate-dependent enzyme [Candidatus Omnitrophota bacterium]
MKTFSKLTGRLLGQPMFHLLEKIERFKKAGRDIIHLEIGDADFRAHQHIIDATKNALDADKTHYVNSMGLNELRDAICEYTLQTLDFRPRREQVLVMPAHAIIDTLIRCVANPGDEIICPEPGFSSYHAVLTYLNLKKTSIPLKEENKFCLQAADIEPKIHDHTRLLIITSPNNPTGSVLSKKQVRDIALLCQQKDIYLLSDEIYSRVIYEGQHYSCSFLDQCRERTIILNGFGKSFSMPGWRLGYAIGPVDLIQKMGLLFQTIYSCCSPFNQYGAIEALTGNQEVVEARIKTYKSLRDFILSEINDIPGITCTAPKGAFYIFPNIKETGLTSAAFADYMLKKADVALLPGTHFGQTGEGYVRICFTKKQDELHRACERIRNALKERVQCDQF